MFAVFTRRDERATSFRLVLHVSGEISTPRWQVKWSDPTWSQKLWQIRRPSSVYPSCPCPGLLHNITTLISPFRGWKKQAESNKQVKWTGKQNQIQVTFHEGFWKTNVFGKLPILESLARFPPHQSQTSIAEGRAHAEQVTTGHRADKEEQTSTVSRNTVVALCYI